MLSDNGTGLRFGFSNKHIPSPVKKRKGKKHRVKKKTRHASDSSDEETGDEEFTKTRMKEHAELAKAAYQKYLARVKSDIVYKSMFPYLG